MMKLEDQHRDSALNDEMETIFSEQFLANLEGPPPFVCLESEDLFTNQCTMLISVIKECTSMANSVLICLK
jgi:hypothetical protein